MTTTASSKFGEPISHKICVIYDPAKGEVIQTHEVLTFPGGRQVTDADAEAEALALLARRTGKDVSGFGVLHVPCGECQRGVRYPSSNSPPDGGSLGARRRSPQQG